MGSPLISIHILFLNLGVDFPVYFGAVEVYSMYAVHSLWLAQKVITENFFLRLLRQKGKSSAYPFTKFKYSSSEKLTGFIKLSLSWG